MQAHVRVQPHFIPNSHRESEPEVFLGGSDLAAAGFGNTERDQDDPNVGIQRDLSPSLPQVPTTEGVLSLGAGGDTSRAVGRVGKSEKWRIWDTGGKGSTSGRHLEVCLGAEVTSLSLPPAWLWDTSRDSGSTWMVTPGCPCLCHLGVRDLPRCPRITSRSPDVFPFSPAREPGKKRGSGDKCSPISPFL